jgi:hypothetical protein
VAHLMQRKRRRRRNAHEEEEDEDEDEDERQSAVYRSAHDARVSVPSWAHPLTALDSCACAFLACVNV